MSKVILFKDLGNALGVCEDVVLWSFYQVSSVVYCLKIVLARNNLWDVEPAMLATVHPTEPSIFDLSVYSAIVLACSWSWYSKKYARREDGGEHRLLGQSNTVKLLISIVHQIQIYLITRARNCRTFNKKS